MQLCVAPFWGLEPWDNASWDRLPRRPQILSFWMMTYRVWYLVWSKDCHATSSHYSSQAIAYGCGSKSNSTCTREL
eukprot:6070813-Amphidinium_carterae.1